MDPRLLQYYNNELRFLRESGGEFAKEFPKIADRIGLDGFDCADPYVERLLEGFAYLTARVHLKLDAEFPRFCQHLLESVYPHYVMPTPSAAVVQFEPDLFEGALADGFRLPRNTVLRGIIGKGDQTACEYQTSHEIRLWPLEVVDANYFSRDVSPINVGKFEKSKAGVRIRLRCVGDKVFSELPLDQLDFYLRGADETPMRLYEQIVGNCVGALIRPLGGSPDAAQTTSLASSQVQPLGFSEQQCLFPDAPQSFSGYRLLHEYFTFFRRFMFVRLSGLRTALQNISTSEVEIVLLFDRVNRALTSSVRSTSFELNCTPALNLFPKRTDRIHLSRKTWEYHVVPDRTRPMDFEVYRVGRVVGFGINSQEQEFLPFYNANDLSSYSSHSAFYSVRRTPRVLSSNQKANGPRSSYIGSEVYLSLVDSSDAPFSHDLRQLGVETLCTNRDLPLHMPIGKGTTDFTMDAGAPVKSIRCLDGPTMPKPPLAFPEGEVAWKLVSHLSLNYLSLLDDEARGGAAALRELLSLYGDLSEPVVRKQIEGVRSVKSASIVRPLPIPGPIAFGRGIEVAVTCDEVAFEGVGVFLLGAVLERFFARQASLNSFTETVLKTTERGEVMRWPARQGNRQRL